MIYQNSSSFDNVYISPTGVSNVAENDTKFLILHQNIRSKFCSHIDLLNKPYVTILSEIWIDTFILELANYLKSKRFANLITIDDVNILNFPTSSDNYMVMMSQHGMDCLINTPTRTIASSSSCIDNIFCNLKNNSASALHLLFIC